jgi:uncharacterized membrane protein
MAGVVLFKLPILAADLLILCLLAGWVWATGGKNSQLAVYAWNPLVIVEFAASGHNDALALAGVASSLVIIRRWPGVSTLLLAAGALAKAFPAVLLPLWLRRAGWPGTPRGWLRAGAAASLAFACAWPYRAAWPQLLESLAYYESRWRHNNASLYSLLTWMTGSPELAVGLGLGVVLGLALWAAARAPSIEPAHAAFLVFGAMLLMSANAWPRYYTWMVLVLAFLPRQPTAPAWLALTVLQFLGYHVLIDYQARGAWRFRPEMLWLTYGPFFALLLWQALRIRTGPQVDADEHG